MAKLSSIKKNERRTAMTKAHAPKRAALKAIIMNKTLTAEERFTAQLKLAEMPRNGAKVRIRNRCEVSGRSRAVYRRFKLSRIILRDMASHGLIPGVTKSSW
jgi:small subunit ribosomal protein S14